MPEEKNALRWQQVADTPRDESSGTEYSLSAEEGEFSFYSGDKVSVFPPYLMFRPHTIAAKERALDKRQSELSDKFDGTDDALTEYHAKKKGIDSEYQALHATEDAKLIEGAFLYKGRVYAGKGQSRLLASRAYFFETPGLPPELSEIARMIYRALEEGKHIIQEGDLRPFLLSEVE